MPRIAVFDRLSIRGKLLLIILAVSVPAVLMMGISVLYFESQRIRESLGQELTAIAALVGNRSLASMAARDEPTAIANLQALEKLPHVEMGCLYNETGVLFAGYIIAGRRDRCPDFANVTSSGVLVDDVGMAIRVPFEARNEPAGAILLRSTLAPVQSRVRSQLTDRGVITVVAIALAVVLALYFQRLISRPIEQIREVAQRIEAGTNPALRAPVASNDELGQLAAAFNRMLDTIQEQNRCLAELNAQLDERVRERTAELEEANRELESFTYTVSHDLRAPLRAILGYSDMLRTDHERGLDAEGTRLLGRITGNAERMARLIDDLLDFAHIGRAEPVVREVQMRSLVDSVIGELPASPGPGPSFVIGALPDARGDPALLRQVWNNLIGNAQKFTRHATDPRIEIGGERRDAMVEYFVRDNGAGFDMQFAGKLFQAFQRLHSIKEYEGSGVGLAIVSRIVQRHGGSVRAEGEAGRGATLRFTLPA